MRLVELSANALRVSRAKSAKLLRYVAHPGGLRLLIQMWALSLLAMAKRALNPRVTYIGVTGSAGKTTTAKLIGTVLATAGECRVEYRSEWRAALSPGASCRFGRWTKFSVHESLRRQAWQDKDTDESSETSDRRDHDRRERPLPKVSQS